MSRDVCCATTSLEEKILAVVRENLARLLSHGGEMHFKKGQALFYEGHYPYGFYVLKKGEVTLLRTTLKGQGQHLPSTPEKLLGLSHLVTNTPYCASLHAKTDVVVSFVPKSLVLELINGLENRTRP